MRIPVFLRRTLDYVRSLMTNGYFWGGLVVLLLIGAVLFFLVNSVIMPTYTRHDVALNVPNVLNEPFEQAEQELRGQDLQVERVVQRFNPNLPRDVVVDQSPPPDASVKPGRRIYLTVNSGRQQMVKVPSLEGLSLREAENRLVALGLQVEETLPDTIPHPHQNTVTRQQPEPGDSLAEGASVSLWYSTGLGEMWTTVPEVTGLPVERAREVLVEHNLRSIVLDARPDSTDHDAEDEPAAEDEVLLVRDQSRDAGTRVREGFEIRLSVSPAEEGEPFETEAPDTTEAQGFF